MEEDEEEEEEEEERKRKRKNAEPPVVKGTLQEVRVPSSTWLKGGWETSRRHWFASCQQSRASRFNPEAHFSLASGQKTLGRTRRLYVQARKRKLSRNSEEEECQKVRSAEKKLFSTHSVRPTRAFGEDLIAAPGKTEWKAR